MTAPTVERRISSPEHRAAYQAAKDSPAEHKPRLITSRSVGSQVHGAGAIGQFNSTLAVLITKNVGTMWAAYIFAVIAVILTAAGIVVGIAIHEAWAAVGQHLHNLLNEQ